MLSLLLLASASSSSASWHRGPRGFRGPRGPSGIQGPQGPVGAIGAPGTTGATGATGAAGLAGAAGVQGVQGTKGIQGATGFTGARGVQGLHGPQGVQGAQGSVGIQGATGAAGAVGPQGPQGATGPSGDPSHNFRSFLNREVSLTNDGSAAPTTAFQCVEYGCQDACALECSPSSRCVEAALPGDATLTVNTAPAMLGLSCDIEMTAPTGTVVQVTAGYPGQGESCSVVHTMIGSGFHEAITESKSAACQMDFSQLDFEQFPVSITPTVSLTVLEGISQCFASHDVEQDFASEFFASTLGWTSRFYANDRLQPINTQFVTQNPLITLDPESPSAIAVRYWECSSFYYADTTLGMHNVIDARNDDVVGVGNSNGINLREASDNITFGFSFAVPELPEDYYEPFSRDDGTMFIGYFHKENEFESSVWYASEYLGVRLYFPADCTEDSVLDGESTDDNPGVRTEDTDTDIHNLDCTPFLKLAVELNGTGDATSFYYARLQRGRRYRFEGVFNPVNDEYYGAVYDLAADGTWDVTDSVNKNPLFIWMNPSDAPGGFFTDRTEAEEDFDGIYEVKRSHDSNDYHSAWDTEASAGTYVPRVLTDDNALFVNSFGIFHQDHAEQTSSDGSDWDHLNGVPDMSLFENAEQLKGFVRRKRALAPAGLRSEFSDRFDITLVSETDIDFDPIPTSERDHPDGIDQACFNEEFHAALGGIVDSYMVGDAATADLIVDSMHYTVPATFGYPRLGEVSARVSCSGETFKTGFADFPVN